MAHVQMFRDHVMTSLDPNSNGTISKTELMDYIHDLRRKKTENATKLPQTDWKILSVLNLNFSIEWHWNIVMAINRLANLLFMSDIIGQCNIFSSLLT